MRNFLFICLFVISGVLGGAIIVSASASANGWFINVAKEMSSICKDNDYSICGKAEIEYDGVDENGGYLGVPYVDPFQEKVGAVRDFISDINIIENVQAGDAGESLLPKADAYRAIVKIKTYALNQQGDLQLFGTGSGIVIDENGLVLTNHHVVVVEDGYDGSRRPTSYQVCLTEAIEKEPVCKYVGRLVAAEGDLDIALIQIEGIPELSDVSKFDYLNLNLTDETDVNDEVTAIGYPALGGETVTITKGIVSGKLDKYGQKWIKTDTIISFGSSGGAALDANGNVIGINTRAHSDLLGNLGYIVNISSVNDWIGLNRSRESSESGIDKELERFTKKQISLKLGNVFDNEYPRFSLTKPSDWGFDYEDNFNFSISNEADEEGGLVMINLVKFPYYIDTDNVIPYINKSFSETGLISMVEISKTKNVQVGGVDAKQVFISMAGEVINGYYIPYNEYMISIAYLYGKDDKNKVMVDSIIDSIDVDVVRRDFSELKEYVHDKPGFSVYAGGDWVLMSQNSKESPLWMVNKDIKSVDAEVKIVKMTNGMKDFNNEELINYFEAQTKSVGRMLQIVGLKFEIFGKDAHFKINGELNDVAKYDLKLMSLEDDEVLVYATVYLLKGKNELVLVEVNGYDISQKSYDKALSSFLEEVMQGFNVRDYKTVMLDTQVKEEKKIVIRNKKMHTRLRGKILLKVEDRGKAYYVHPGSEEMYYLGRAEDAFAIMRAQGVGITNVNLDKIEIGHMTMVGEDSDGDGFTDMFEDAIGTNKDSIDTDNDGFGDKGELIDGFDPRGIGMMKYDKGFSDGQKGKIFLQVEGKGEAWYVNPSDGKRYFLGRPADAYNAMRNLGLGISDKDFLLME